MFKAAVLIQFFAVEGKKLARSEILSNQCLELDVQQRKRFCGGAEIWQSDNFRSAQFDVFCNWNAPPSFVAFYDFCLQSLVSSCALYVNSSITLSKCSSSSKWEFCFKSKLSGHLIASTMLTLTKWSELPLGIITRELTVNRENFQLSSSTLGNGDWCGVARVVHVRHGQAPAVIRGRSVKTRGDRVGSSRAIVLSPPSTS